MSSFFAALKRWFVSAQEEEPSLFFRNKKNHSSRTPGVILLNPRAVLQRTTPLAPEISALGFSCGAVPSNRSRSGRNTQEAVLALLLVSRRTGPSSSCGVLLFFFKQTNSVSLSEEAETNHCGVSLLLLKQTSRRKTVVCELFVVIFVGSCVSC